MTHPSSVPESARPASSAPLHPTGPATPRWAPSAAEPTVQLPAGQAPRPAWVPLEPRPSSHPSPYALEPQVWDRPAPNPYETTAPVAWAYQPDARQLVHQPDPRQLAYQQSLYAAQKSRVGAGVLAIVLGVFGVHNFYLGRSGVAVLQLLLTVLSLGVLSPLVWVWSVVEGILILVGSPSFAADRRGIPLR
ncbi:NINE protein [Microlunatus lacustris]